MKRIYLDMEVVAKNLMEDTNFPMIVCFHNRVKTRCHKVEIGGGSVATVEIPQAVSKVTLWLETRNTVELIWTDEEGNEVERKTII